MWTWNCGSGYYAAPRDASLADVADELGIAEATASELLRRAESRLMQRLVGRTGPPTSVSADE